MIKITKKNIEEAIKSGFTINFIGVPTNLKSDFEHKFEGSSDMYTVKSFNNRYKWYKEKYCNENNGKSIRLYLATENW